MPPGLAAVKENDPARDKVMHANHELANRFALQTAEAKVIDGAFEVRFQLPDKLLWPRLTVRAYAATKTAEAWVFWPFR